MDSDTVTQANDFLWQITNFQFLVSFSIAMMLLSSMCSSTVKLQKQSKDILAIYDQVADVQPELEL